jgi:hypothetical protein
MAALWREADIRRSVRSEKSQRRLSGKKKRLDVNQFMYGKAARPQCEHSTLQFSIWSLEKLDCREARNAMCE